MTLFLITSFFTADLA